MKRRVTIAALTGCLALFAASATLAAGEFGFNWLPARDDDARGASFDRYFAPNSRRGRALTAEEPPARPEPVSESRPPAAPETGDQGIADLLRRRHEAKARE